MRLKITIQRCPGQNTFYASSSQIGCSAFGRNKEEALENLTKKMIPVFEEAAKKLRDPQYIFKLANVTFENS